MIRIATLLPAVGLFGLALYQVINQADFVSAIHTIGQAGAVFGIGHGVQVLKSSQG